MIDLTIRAPCGNGRVLVSWNTAVFLLVRNAAAVVVKSGTAPFFTFLRLYRPVLFGQGDADNVALGSDAQPVSAASLSGSHFFPSAEDDGADYPFILLV